MTSRRIFVHDPLRPDSAVKLGASAAAHVSRVLRLEPGDELTLFDGHGGQYPATLTEVRGATVMARTGTHANIERESPLQLTLVQGISRGERMDWVVQKATELGVASIVPVLTERSVVRLDAQQSAKKVQHWRGIAIAACEQCGRNRLPRLALPLSFEAWLSSRTPATNEWLLDPEATESFDNVSGSEATLLIGPEGGLADQEQDQARTAGFKSAKLGPRILRTETAAITAIAVLQARHGDL